MIPVSVRQYRYYLHISIISWCIPRLGRYLILACVVCIFFISFMTRYNAINFDCPHTQVNVVADPADPAVRRKATAFLWAVARNDETYLGLSGNFSFTTGGMTLSPRNYVQPPNIPSCLQVPPKAGSDPKPCHNRSKPHQIAKWSMPSVRISYLYILEKIFEHTTSNTCTTVT